MFAFFTLLALTIIHVNAQNKTDFSPSIPVIDSNTNQPMIRQCDCLEEKECTSEMKIQAMECLEPCWQKFEKVTREPLKLKICFDDQRNFMGRFLDCFENNLKGCSLKNDTNLIPKTEIASYFQVAVTKIRNAPNSLVGSITTPIKELLDTSGVFAQCVNNCFIAKNANGFCFDRIGCQPLITESSAKTSLHTCVRKLNWKEVAGETCDCAVNSGLTSLKSYCPILKLMSRKFTRRSHKSKNILK